MRLPRLLRRAIGQLRRRFAPRAAILMYHRVGVRGSDFWSLCVTPEHFAEHMQVLQAHGHTLRLSELVEAQRRVNTLRRAVAVTFDDGYADNLYNAAPLLARYQIPATVFVTTGQVGCEREFWWDELERYVLQPGALPEMLHLEANNTAHRWVLGTAAEYSADEYRRDHERLAWEGEPGSRLWCYYALWTMLRPLPQLDQRMGLEAIRLWAGAQPEARPTHRTLSHEELRVLSRTGPVEIGAHTVTHPCLTVHGAAYQRGEIEHGKTQLEQWLNQPVSTFSYPFGDFTPQTAAIVREAGFGCACSTRQDYVDPWDNRYQLPRFEIQDWDGAEFEQRLLSWLDS